MRTGTWEDEAVGLGPPDFCHACGAGIPPRLGEGTCAVCDPAGVRRHMAEIVDARIFVFGSNRRGIHRRGAALFAVEKRGARMYLGEGRQGQSYALPTKETPSERLCLSDIEAHVRTFLSYATIHPELRFEVTRVGCGLAGYTDSDIAPFFKDAPVNCDLPKGWR